MELKYIGTFVEEEFSPNVKYQRRYRLDATLFVLDAAPRRFDVAFMTSLSLREQANDARSSGKNRPTSVRLETATLDGQGQPRPGNFGCTLVRSTNA